MSIGWIMFWKAVVLSIGIAVIERYRSYKKARREQGVVLRYDEKRDLYFDPLERTERRLRIAVYIVGGLFLAYGLLVTYLLITVNIQIS